MIVIQLLYLHYFFFFFLKVAKMIFETNAIHVTRTEKKIMEVLDFMPDVSTRMNAMYKFKRLITMPINL